jgi:ribonuclease-3
VSEPALVDRRELEQRLGYRFRNPALLETALTHSSAMPSGPVRSGEQLEFLGDAVVDLAIAHLLLQEHPEADEGQLSKWRAMLVRTSTLAGKARELDLGDALLVGRGEERSGGRDKDSILAWAYESVLGAIYRDGGFARARAVVRRHFRRDLKQKLHTSLKDWKTSLQEETQARYRTVPEYRLTAESGPAHAREFTCEVWVEGSRVACGSGTCMREAEQRAAQAALEAFTSG